jgi:RNA polymerase sigma factor (sigma-70 family)
MPKTDGASNSLCCRMSMPPSISRVGCCEAAQMPKMSLRKPYFARTVSSAAFMVEMRAHGCSRSYAILATHGWRRNAPMELSMEFDEELHLQTCATPETLAIAGDDQKRLTLALETLPPRFREILVLRELEGCSYKEIAAITAIPIGTVMSSLSRARRQLYSVLVNSPQGARP